jgi:hypothetical protein
MLKHRMKSINVIERKEFRELLLILRENLHDSDIPRRTSVRNKIMETWKHYLATLTSELGVNIQFLTFKATNFYVT